MKAGRKEEGRDRETNRVAADGGYVIGCKVSLFWRAAGITRQLILYG